MKEFQGIIKKKGILKSILYSIFILLMLLPLIILKKQVIGSFKGTCVAKSFDGLQKCEREGRFTTIETTNIYEAGYNYVVDGKVVGKFLDVDLEGNVIVTLADTATADELLNGEGLRQISGTFVSFNNKVFKNTLDKMQQDYIERFALEEEIITEKQVKEMFFPRMFNQYDGRGFPYILPVILVGIGIALLAYKLLEGLKMIFRPNKFVVYKGKTLEQEENVDKASFEFQNGPYLFQNKDVRITNNYIFDLKGFGFTYHKVNEAVWMYEKGMKRYGLVETGKYLIIKFKDKVGLGLALDTKERKKVMEILRVKNPKIINGYDQITAQNYKKDPIKLK